MSEGNKITIAINSAQMQRKQAHQIDGMIALKKIEHYSYGLTDDIGLGYSSHVFKGKNDLTNEQVAIKVIDMRKDDELTRQFINDEIAVLEAVRAVNAPNLLRLYDVFQTKNNLYIVTEFCEGKDMAKILRKCKTLQQAEAQSVMKQLLKGYEQLHRIGIVHRDLKLANVFVKEGCVKLADFGFAVKEEKCKDKFSYNVGSPYYMPPQALKHNRYSFKSDVWGMGVIAYELVFGRLPWKDKNESVLYDKIMSSSLEDLFDNEIPLSQPYKRFIKGCLQAGYERRMTPEAMLKHPWDMAVDYVGGFSDVEAGRPLVNVKPNSQSNVQAVFNHSTRESLVQDQQFRIARRVPQEISHEGNYQDDVRNNSKTMQRLPSPNQFVTIFQSPKKEIPSNGMELGNNNCFVNGAQQDNYENVERAILGLIHYCRFLYRLCMELSQTGFPEGQILRNELIAKILSKCEVLKRQATDVNVLQLQGFISFSQTEKWQRLKELIDRYETKFKDGVANMRTGSGEYHEEALTKLIKLLAGNLRANFGLTEDLVYYYQLKRLEANTVPSSFAENSLIELLALRRPPGEVSYGLCERLGTRISQLGL